MSSHLAPLSAGGVPMSSRLDRRWRRDPDEEGAAGGCP